MSNLPSFKVMSASLEGKMSASLEITGSGELGLGHTFNIETTNLKTSVIGSMELGATNGVACETPMNNGNSLLVVGGGVAGLTATIEAAEAGCSVILIEKSAFLSGRPSASILIFPSCARRLVDLKSIFVASRTTCGSGF